MSQTDTSTGTGSGKSPIVALVLSFFIWGVGQLYQGRTKVGAIWLVVYLVSGVLTIISGFLFAPIAFVLWVVCLYDAYTEKF
jgi:uncharacterized membrane protein